MENLSSRTESRVAAAAKTNKSKKVASPSLWRIWGIGSFYLFAMTVVCGLLMIASQIIPSTIFPIFVIGAFLSLTIIGLFQQLATGILSEMGFIRVILHMIDRLTVLKPKQSAQKNPTSLNSSQENLQQ